MLRNLKVRAEQAFTLELEARNAPCGNKASFVTLALGVKRELLEALGSSPFTRAAELGHVVCITRPSLSGVYRKSRLSDIP